MNIFHRLISVLLLTVLAIPTLNAFAKEEGMRMTISGPGIAGEAAIESSDLLMRLEDTGFFGFSGNITAIHPLESVGEGYRITAYYGKSNTIMPFIEMEYYPADEGAGYVHYTSKLDGESFKPVDEWGRLPLRAEQAFRRLMNAHRITLQTAVLSSSSSVVTPTPDPSFAIAAIAVALAILSAGLILRKRAVSQRGV